MRRSVLLTKMAENMLSITPMASVAAKPCTTVAPSVSANQYRMPDVISVETLLSRIADHARLKPMLIEESSVRPDAHLLLHSLENQDVGVHCHADRQDRRSHT